MRRVLFAVLCLGVFSFPLSAAPAAKPLQIYFIDVEGGQSTLIVTPQGQSLLIDAGWPGNEGRDSDRIKAAANQAGIKRIDYLLITHYHMDHVGGVPQLAEGLPIGTFIDHGPNQEETEVTRMQYDAYEKVVAGHPHITAKPGMKLPLKGIDVQVIAAAGEHITSPLTGAGDKNSYCSNESAGEDKSENARSVGFLLTYGKFKFLDLGDLTQQKELELACPNNLIGKADLFLVTHHGTTHQGPDGSNSKALDWAIHPRVSVIDNGPRKGATAAAWQIVHDSPGLEDLWQLHYAAESDRDHNVADDHIANVKENCEGKFLKAIAQSDGSFTITNARTGEEKSYPKK